MSPRKILGDFHVKFADVGEMVTKGESLVGVLPNLDDPIKWDDYPWEFPLVDFPG